MLHFESMLYVRKLVVVSTILFTFIRVSIKQKKVGLLSLFDTDENYELEDSRKCLSVETEI